MGTTTSNHAKVPFRPDIQGLRAISVLLVVFFHAGIGGFHAGYLGVDIFFVISGYWMTMLVQRDLDQGTFRFRDFYARRVRRILPALYFSLLLTLIIAWFVLWPQDFRDFMKVLGSTVLLFSNNVLMILGDGYFAPEMEYQPLLHMWSLSVEEQFYLFFPLFLFLIGFLWQPARYGLVVLIPVASLVWAIWAFHAESVSASFVFYQLPGRVWEFAVGGLVAWWVLREKPIYPWLGYIGMVLVVAALFLVDETERGPGIGVIFVVVGAALLLFPGTERSSALSVQLLSYPLLVWIGGLSFSLYLIHQPVLSFARHYGVMDPSTLLVLSIGIGIPLSALMKKFVEDPFRNKSIVSRNKLVVVMVSSTVALIGIAVYAVENKGLPDRFDPLTTQITETAWGSPLRKQCHDVDLSEACVHFGDTQPTWVILGDSHVPAVAYALGERLKEDHQSILHLSVSGCGLADESSRCRTWYRAAMDRILGDERLTHVVFSTRFGSQMYGAHKFTWPEVPRMNTDAHRERVKREYAEAIDTLISAGKQVIWVQQAPEVGLNLSAVMRQAVSQQGVAVSVPRHWWRERTEGFEAYYDTLRDRVTFINPEALFCDSNDCYAVKDGVTRYRDRDHVSLSGAREIVEEMDRRGLFLLSPMSAQ